MSTPCEYENCKRKAKYTIWYHSYYPNKTLGEPNHFIESCKEHLVPLARNIMLGLPDEITNTGSLGGLKSHPDLLKKVRKSLEEKVESKR